MSAPVRDRTSAGHENTSWHAYSLARVRPQVFSFLWMFTFPLAIASEYVWYVAVPLCSTLGFIVVKTDDMTDRLSLPFGEGYHDLPLDVICTKIEEVCCRASSK